MFTFLTVFIVIAAILLIIVVLLQNGKGQGMASNFTSATVSGVDVTEKIENTAAQPEFPSAPVQQANPAQEAPAADSSAE